MPRRLRIRSARQGDLDEVAQLRRASILSSERQGTTRKELQSWAGRDPARRYRRRLEDGCLLVAETGSRLLATGSLSLARPELAGLFVAPDVQRTGLGRRMIVALERLAVQFGITQLTASATVPSFGFWTACGYRSVPGRSFRTDRRSGMSSQNVSRTFPRRQTRFGKQVARLCDELGISNNYGRSHRLRLQEEATELARIGQDRHGRERHLTPEAANAWNAMRLAAADEGLELEPASAFRDVDYQAGIIRRKIEAGQDVETILAVSAAPGYSEHHTGRAVDIATPGSEPMEEEFEQTTAFEWLIANAHRYGFRLSYPRNNRHGILYEPWHWFYTG